MYKKVFSIIISALFLISMLPGCNRGQTTSNQTGSIPSQPDTSLVIDEITTPDVPLPDPVPDQDLNDPIMQMESASLQYPSQNDTWKYNVYDCYIEITGYLGPEEADAVIPAEIDGLPVWKLGDGSLMDAELKSAQLPDCLESIGMLAFANSKIETIIMPKELAAVGQRAFDGCVRLSAIGIPEGVIGVAKETFEGCENLSEISLPESLTFIDESAFSGCVSLSNITIPENVTYIGPLAFTKCTSLHSVYVPAAVKKIESWTFSHCTNLSQVQLEEGIESIEEGAFSDCQNLESLVLPASVSSIGTNEWHRPPFDGVADNFDLTILNPDIVLHESIRIFGQYQSENKVIHGYAGSTAAKYCANRHIAFQLIE